MRASAEGSKVKTTFLTESSMYMSRCVISCTKQCRMPCNDQSLCEAASVAKRRIEFFLAKFSVLPGRVAPPPPFCNLSRNFSQAQASIRHRWRSIIHLPGKLHETSHLVWHPSSCINCNLVSQINCKGILQCTTPLNSNCCSDVDDGDDDDVLMS